VQAWKDWGIGVGAHKNTLPHSPQSRGVGDGRAGVFAPPQIREKYFSDRYHDYFGILLIFYTYRPIFGQNVLPPKLNELLRLCPNPLSTDHYTACHPSHRTFWRSCVNTSSLCRLAIKTVYYRGNWHVLNHLCLDRVKATINVIMPDINRQQVG